MVTQSVRLPEDLEVRLDRLAKANRRSKSSYIIEALERFLEDQEDLEIALARFRDPETEWLDHNGVKRELNLD